MFTSDTYGDLKTYAKYLIAGGIAIGEKHYDENGNLIKNIRYTFDENGSVCGYSVSTDGSTWTEYYFIRNLQGDVLQVYCKDDGAIIALIAVAVVTITAGVLTAVNGVADIQQSVTGDNFV